MMENILELWLCMFFLPAVFRDVITKEKNSASIKMPAFLSVVGGLSLGIVLASKFISLPASSTLHALLFCASICATFVTIRSKYQFPILLFGKHVNDKDT